MPGKGSFCVNFALLNTKKNTGQPLSNMPNGYLVFYIGSDAKSLLNFTKSCLISNDGHIVMKL